jgi:predicted transcriptional regulator/transcriptional regulator with XRE-family HTH domain
MARGTRIFAGQKLRQLRLDLRMDQAAMARNLGISVSYLSQLENDDRPLTATVKAALAESFPLDWAAFDEREEEQLLGAFTYALAHPEVASAPLEAERIEKMHLQYPEFAARYVDLHRAYARSTERLNMIEEAIASDMAAQARMPWEAVRDWFHDAGNYVHALDCLAEDLSAAIAPEGRLSETALIVALADRHRIAVETVEARDTSFRAYDAASRRLAVNAALPLESRTFMLAHQLMQAEGAVLIAETVAQAAFPMPGADQLLAVGLANYAAGALLMPYGHYREAARALRHDIDRLARRFGVSFEQACHRLSTLQRPGLRGIPFFFCRVDMAGNITKRHSATRLQFARFGGGCPMWIVHEAVAIPDRILVQLGETPDGVRYVSMAKGLVKPSGTFARQPRRYAVALGCEVEHAGNFIYADGLQLHDEAAASPIGVACRLCPRQACDQRAFPPADRMIRVDPDNRQVVPYWID